jgi:hypothetical protein
VTPVAGNGTVIQDVVIDFGDPGGRTDLGAVTGTAIALHHVYQNGGTYTVTLTATDSNGGVGTGVTTVFVQAATPLGVTLTASPTFAGLNTIETFTATVTGLGNAVVLIYRWDFNTGEPTVSTTTNTITHSYAHGTTTYTPSVTITTSAPPPNNTASNTTVITP